MDYARLPTFDVMGNFQPDYPGATAAITSKPPELGLRALCKDSPREAMDVMLLLQGGCPAQPHSHSDQVPLLDALHIPAQPHLHSDPVSLLAQPQVSYNRVSDP